MDVQAVFVAVGDTQIGDAAAGAACHPGAHQPDGHRIDGRHGSKKTLHRGIAHEQVGMHECHLLGSHERVLAAIDFVGAVVEFLVADSEDGLDGKAGGRNRIIRSLDSVRVFFERDNYRRERIQKRQ